jgi:glycosyltransferase involved in cell wall biosynthesis
MVANRVAVVLSTYNGEKYVGEQINSILAQRDVEVTLLVRDDGSRDATVALVREFEARHSNVRCVSGANQGVTRSFLSALESADPSCDYFAFSDQDDLWSANKLPRALEAIRAEADPGKPLLYCSKLELVDETLDHIAFTRSWRHIGFQNALFQNIVTGCTVVMNKTARELVLRGDRREDILIHDWWCYLVISAFGKIVYDDRSSIKYRQHGGNQVGMQSSLTGRVKSRLKRTVNGLNGRFPSEQNRFFLLVHGPQLSSVQRSLLESALAAKSSFFKRIVLAFSRKIRAQTGTENISIRLGILLNKF